MPSCKISGAIRDCHPSSSSRCAVWWSATPAMGSSTRRKIAASSFTPSFISVSTPKASGRKSDACSAWVEWENRTCRGTPSSGQFPRPAFTRRFPCGRRGSRLSAAQPPPFFRARLPREASDSRRGSRSRKSTPFSVSGNSFTASMLSATALMARNSGTRLPRAARGWKSLEFAGDQAGPASLNRPAALSRRRKSRPGRNTASP